MGLSIRQANRGRDGVYYQPVLPHPPPLPAPGRIKHPITFGLIAAWSATLFCLLMLSNGWAAPLTGYNVTAEDSALLRNAYFPVYGVLLGLMITNPGPLARLMLKEAVLIGILVLAFASALWSIDPAATFRRSMALAFTTLAGLVLAARWSWRAAAELVATMFAIDGCLSLVLGAAVPAMGRMHELFPGAWRGVWLEKNALGGLMAIGALVQIAAAIYAPQRRLLWIAMAVISATLVILSQSKTSLLSLMLGLAVLGTCAVARRGPAAAVLACWIAVSSALVASAFLLVAPDLLLDTLGKDATLTGRTTLWQAAWRQLETRPLLGFGYGVLWDKPDGWGPAAWIAHDAKFRAGHAHNGWLETALGLGFVGFACWMLYFLQTVGRSIREFFVSDGSYLALPLIAIFVLRSFTEASILDYHDITWVLFVLVAAKMVRIRH